MTEKIFVLTEEQLNKLKTDVLNYYQHSIPYSLPEPIVLPSDEELKEEIYQEFNVQGTLSRTEDVHYFLGMKTMRDKILKAISTT